jgi:hypothetical protein
VQDRRDLCSGPIGPVINSGSLTPIVIGPIPVVNTSTGRLVLNYRAVVIADTMLPDLGVVSLNSLPPGTPVTGTLDLARGATTNLNLSARFIVDDPLHFYTVLIETDADGDGTFDPLTSIGLRNVLPPPCEPAFLTQTR